MSTVKALCIATNFEYPPTLVFNIAWDYNQNVTAWDMHSGHGPASIDYIETCTEVTGDVAKEYLESYTKHYDRDKQATWELVSKEEFINNYYEG